MDDCQMLTSHRGDPRSNPVWHHVKFVVDKIIREQRLLRVYSGPGLISMYESDEPPLAQHTTRLSAHVSCFKG
jgi:hypothetical protein